MSEGNLGPSTQRGAPREPIVRPELARVTVRPMSEAESNAIQGIARNNVNETIQRITLPDVENTHTGHVKHTDDPILNAQASLLYSAAYTITGFFVITALLILTGITDGDIGAFVGIEIFGTGLVGIVALIINRRQGLHHSATGIAHGELKTRERIYDRNATVEEHRINKETEVRLADIQARREIGLAMLNRLEAKRDE